MKTTAGLILFTLALLNPSTAHADSFGSGLNAFDIDFVTIGNPGNADDFTGAPTTAGKVDYTYRMGKFEISEDMIDKAGLGLSHDGRGANKPATNISWLEAAEFVNWLNTDSGSTPAYKFVGSSFQLWESGDTGYDATNRYRNTQAKYFLPSMDEWYKAAYYSPSGTYYDYPTGSNSRPDGIDSAGDTTFDAVFYDGGTNSVLNDITDVGVLSPYGTAGQGGNVWEWEETSNDLLNNSSSSARGIRGGSWGFYSTGLLSSYRLSIYPADVYSDIGFRVASIPEPSTALLGALATAGLLVRRRRLS